MASQYLDTLIILNRIVTGFTSHGSQGQLVAHLQDYYAARGMWLQHNDEALAWLLGSISDTAAVYIDGDGPMTPSAALDLLYPAG